MNAPQIRLIQAHDLDAWQRALLTLSLPVAEAASGAPRVLDPPVVVVPSRAAAEQWRRTVEQRLLVEAWQPSPELQRALEHQVRVEQIGALAMPHLVTRDELYGLWHRRARLDVPRLSPVVREVFMGASAREAARQTAPPFMLRPGLIAEMARFFDRLGRLGRNPVQWLDEAAAQLEEEADMDRGAARLLLQTQFLRAAFERYASRLQDADAMDDVALRAALGQTRHAWSPAHLVVAVADHQIHDEGLWPADLTLIARARGTARVDVVATARVADGLFERLRRAWPSASVVSIPAQQASAARLEVTSAERRVIVCRDRDEEVVAYARRVKATQATAPSASALVYRRPLPYLYAARYVLDSAGIPYQTSATLPLAAEPWAASLDLLMDAALSGFTRGALVMWLRSPHVALPGVQSDDIAAFDAWLAERRYLGTLEHLDALLAEPAITAAPGARSREREAARADASARQVARAIRPVLVALTPLLSNHPGERHIRALREAWALCERIPQDDDPEASRTRRTRAAVDQLLTQLQDALARHDPAPVPPRDTCLLVRRWIEERTFALSRRDDGVHLVDAESAPFGVFAHVRVVGLIEGEWPEPQDREIFYPAFMLDGVGWPDARGRAAALRARFADLLTLPSSRIGVSVPELDQDAVVRPSSLLDELEVFDASRLDPVPADELSMPVTREDALLASPAWPQAPVLDEAARDWATWRLRRPAPPTPGQTAPVLTETYSVTAVETYLQCPFQYFASRVLGLREDVEDEPGMPAREAGLFLHDLLRECYEAWRKAGHTVVRAEDLPKAREVFTAVAEAALRRLPPADRVVERTRLLGSAVAPGVLEKVLRIEVRAFGDVVQRALEHAIDGPVDLPGPAGPRRVRLRGYVDRVDFTEDGRVRVVDYKIGRRPTRPLQPGVYAHAVAQQERARGREVGLAPSGFIAFREEAPWTGGRVETAVEQAREFVEAVEAIERGEFPVKPHNEFRCQFCDFAGVCRKDYVGD